jgi:hypothetical protein
MTGWRDRLAGGVFVAAVLAVQAVPPQETLIARLLRISGLTAAPSQMRGPADEVLAGNIWMVPIGGGAPRALTTDGGYRSPVFATDGTIYALKGDTLVRMPSQGGAMIRVQDAKGLVKLVGFDRSAPAELLVVLAQPAAGPLGIVSLQTGRLTVLPSTQSPDEQRVLAQARAQDRVYADTTLYTKTETRQGLSRVVEWIDVYVQRGATTPRNISQCDGVSCVQPSLAPDGRSVVFIKAE